MELKNSCFGNSEDLASGFGWDILLSGQSSGLILLTWQKLAPISVLYQISPSINLNLILILSILSIMIGGWGRLNQTQLWEIIAYSSIAHIGWVTAILLYNPL